MGEKGHKDDPLIGPFGEEGSRRSHKDSGYEFIS